MWPFHSGKQNTPALNTGDRPILTLLLNHSSCLRGIWPIYRTLLTICFARKAVFERFLGLRKIYLQKL